MHRDDHDLPLPFPFFEISNGEFLPRLPGTRQRRAAQILAAEADRRARKLGVTRRQFLLSAAGTATAFLALNRAYGVELTGDAAAFPLDLAQTWEDAAARRLFAAPYFVMDVQLHHVDLNDPVLDIPSVAERVSCLRFVPEDVTCTPEGLDMLGQVNLGREVFIESDTEIGVLSGLPGGFPLPPETMAETRDLINGIAGTQRCLLLALCEPRNPSASATSIDSLEHQVIDNGAIGVKCYTTADRWWLDDEQVAYPMYEELLRLGVDVVSVHKGLPGIFDPTSGTFAESRDLPKALRDWPELRFVAYHSGYFPDKPAGQEIAEFLGMARALPPQDKTRLYAEIGSAFAIALTRGPLAAAFLVGSLLRDLGERNILWGTDSIWWGTPRWQIDAFKALRIPPRMQEQFGFPALTNQTKERIAGLNAAELYGIDAESVRVRSRNDGFARAREDLRAEGRPRSYGTYGPRNRREFLGLMGRGRAQEPRRAHTTPQGRRPA